MYSTGVVSTSPHLRELHEKKDHATNGQHKNNTEERQGYVYRRLLCISLEKTTNPGTESSQWQLEVGEGWGTIAKDKKTVAVDRSRITVTVGLPSPYTTHVHRQSGGKAKHSL